MLIAGESPRSVFIAGESPRSIFIAGESPRSVLIAGESPRSILIAGESPRSIFIAGESPRSVLIAGESNVRTMRAALSRRAMDLGVPNAHRSVKRALLCSLSGDSSGIVAVTVAAPADGLAGWSSRTAAFQQATTRAPGPVRSAI
jgi:hypothetical protein